MNSQLTKMFILLTATAASVRGTVSIAWLPEEFFVPHNTPSVVKVFAEGNGHLSYQWFEGEQALSNGRQAELSLPAFEQLVPHFPCSHPRQPWRDLERSGVIEEEAYHPEAKAHTILARDPQALDTGRRFMRLMGSDECPPN